MYKAVEAQLVQHIIIEEWDRLSDEPADVENFFEFCKEHKVQVHFSLFGKGYPVELRLVARKMIVRAEDTL